MDKNNFNKAVKISRNIIEIDKVLDSSKNLKHPNLRGLFCSSLLILMEDGKFKEHFTSFLKNEKKMNEEIFNSL